MRGRVDSGSDSTAPPQRQLGRRRIVSAFRSDQVASWESVDCFSSSAGAELTKEAVALGL